MTYSQYWYRPIELPAQQFAAFSRDVAKMVQGLPPKLVISEISEDAVNLLSPGEKSAADVASIVTFLHALNDDERADRTERMLEFSSSPGGEPILIPRVLTYIREWNTPDWRGWYWNGAKTKLSPYDVIVCAILTLLWHHFPNQCQIESDGGEREWRSGLELARQATGHTLHLPFYRHRHSLSLYRFLSNVHRINLRNAVPKEQHSEIIAGAIKVYRLDIAKAFSSWSADVAKVIAETDIPLAGPDGVGIPIVTPRFVAFNGVGEEGFEPFRARIDDLWIEDEQRAATDEDEYEATSFNTMGNAGKRYDEVVTAALALLAHYFPGHPTAWNNGAEGLCRLASDGDPADWQAGIALAERATGHRIHLQLDKIEDHG